MLRGCYGQAWEETQSSDCLCFPLAIEKWFKRRTGSPGGPELPSRSSGCAGRQPCRQPRSSWGHRQRAQSPLPAPVHDCGPTLEPIGARCPCQLLVASTSRSGGLHICTLTWKPDFSVEKAGLRAFTSTLPSQVAAEEEHVWVSVCGCECSHAEKIKPLK